MLREQFDTALLAVIKLMQIILRRLFSILRRLILRLVLSMPCLALIVGFRAVRIIQGTGFYGWAAGDLPSTTSTSTPSLSMIYRQSCRNCRAH